MEPNQPPSDKGFDASRTRSFIFCGRPEGEHTPATHGRFVAWTPTHEGPSTGPCHVDDRERDLPPMSHEEARERARRKARAEIEARRALA